MNNENKEAFESWIRDRISELPKSDDIHIDEIMGKRISRELWIDIGMSVFEFSQEIKNQKKLSCDLALAIPLQAEHFSKPINFSTKDDLQRELDEFTPPSIYIFTDFYSMIEQTNFREINIEFLKKTADFFYSLYQQPRKTEFSRTLWIANRK